MADVPVVLREPTLVVLVGPSGAGKSWWAARHFEPSEIVSSDHLRAVVGRGEDDLEASADAFALLDEIVEKRLGRGLLTVVDSIALDDARRQHYRERAAAHGVPCVAVAFDIKADECRRRNRGRARPLPADAIKQQLARWAIVRPLLDDEGFERVIRPTAVRTVPAHAAAPREKGNIRATGSHATTLRLGLHISSFPWPADEAGRRLAVIAKAAESAGFASIWVMDHLRQIPQVGRDWDPMFEAYSALSWMAAWTSEVRLGALVTPVTFRNVGLLAKTIATLDVVSGGRAICGLGLGWYGREHEAYGMAFPDVATRYGLLEDALEALPLLWGKGAPAFTGREITIPEAIGYPRPLQPRIPILVGGGGERRTLALSARYADAVNLMGPAETVAHKVAVLHGHCRAVDRDPAEIAVTVLAPTLMGSDRSGVRSLVDRLRPPRLAAERYAASVHAGTPADQVDRFRTLAGAGAHEVIVSLPALGLGSIDEDADLVAAFGSVIAELGAGPPLP